jgi:hypothetical protein
MRYIQRKLFILMILSSLTLAFSGCASGRVIVTKRPPAKRVVIRPKKPHKHTIWVSGHWKWHRGRYVWSKGYWVKQKPGYIWIDGRWQKTPRGWVWRSGHWKRVR